MRVAGPTLHPNTHAHKSINCVYYSQLPVCNIDTEETSIQCSIAMMTKSYGIAVLKIEKNALKPGSNHRSKNGSRSAHIHFRLNAFTVHMIGWVNALLCWNNFQIPPNERDTTHGKVSSSKVLSSGDDDGDGGWVTIS